MARDGDFRPYTLWSRGRLLGDTDLGFIFREQGHRVGWFHPNELGERLMPFATGVAPAIRAEFMLGPDASLHADVLAAVDQEEALELELHGPDGKTIETESIAIIDTDYLLSIPTDDRDYEDVELTPEEEADIEELVEAFEAKRALQSDETEEETEWPRYQIQVELVDWGAVP